MHRLIGIVAMPPSRVIGRDGTLPWHLPEDLAFFKRTTLGHPVVMGRLTYESIGRPLPRRRNIVLTTNATWKADGVETIASPAALARLDGLEGDVFVIGGAKVYEAFLPLLDELLISHLDQEYEGDTRFPSFEDQFKEGQVVESHHGFVVKRWIRS